MGGPESGRRDGRHVARRIACQLRLALEMFGEYQPGADREDPESYAFDAWGDDIDGQLMRNMLAGAERLA